MPSWLPVGQVPELAPLMAAPAYGAQPGYVAGPQGGALQYGMTDSYYVSAPPGRKIANFGWRLLAYVIDYIVL